MVFYTIAGLVSALTQTETGFSFPMPISTALMVGPICGIIAGLFYGVLGFPVALLLEKSERFRKGNEYLKTIIRSEIAIVAGTMILAMLGILLVFIPARLGFYPEYPELRLVPLIQPLERAPEVILTFSMFPLIGLLITEAFKRGFNGIKKILLAKFGGVFK
ncbi:MAG: hypothetical protein NC827_09855 [Candidatus Omnitrophica bacterium]|nr:hypothetical protein [Candidatus Omnitrophota bacterium]